MALEDISKLESKEEKEKALCMFWILLAEKSAIFSVEGSDNCGWHICSKDELAATYLSCELHWQGDVEKDLQFLLGFAKGHQEVIGEPAKCSVSEETVRDVMEYLDAKYDFGNKVFSRQRAEIILSTNPHKGGTGGTLFRYNPETNALCVFALFFGETSYSATNAMLFSPAYAVIDKMASALCYVACAEGRDPREMAVPEDWLDMLEGCGRASIRKKCLSEQQAEVSDAIKWAIIADSPYRGTLVYMKLEQEKERLPVYRELLMEALERVGT